MILSLLQWDPKIEWVAVSIERAVSLFGVVMAFNTLLFIILHAYILRNLIKPELISEQIPHIIRKSFVGVFSYLIGAVAAWFAVHLAFLSYFLTPLFFIVPPTRRDVAQPKT